MGLPSTPAVLGQAGSSHEFPVSENSMNAGSSLESAGAFLETACTKTGSGRCCARWPCSALSRQETKSLRTQGRSGHLRCYLSRINILAWCSASKTDGEHVRCIWCRSADSCHFLYGANKPAEAAIAQLLNNDDHTHTGLADLHRCAMRERQTLDGA